MFPCDVHIVALRTLSQPTIYTNDKINFRNTLPKKSLALIIHRYGFKCNNKFEFMSCRSPLGEVLFFYFYIK